MLSHSLQSVGSVDCATALASHASVQDHDSFFEELAEDLAVDKLDLGEEGTWRQGLRRAGAHRGGGGMRLRGQQ